MTAPRTRLANMRMDFGIWLDLCSNWQYFAATASINVPVSAAGACVLNLSTNGLSHIWRDRSGPGHRLPRLETAEMDTGATSMLIETVLQIGVTVLTTINLTMWAFRPNQYRTSRLRRAMWTWTVAWAIAPPAAGAVDLASGGAWQGDLPGAVALACWPVIILALIKLRLSRAAQHA